MLGRAALLHILRRFFSIGRGPFTPTNLTMAWNICILSAYVNKIPYHNMEDALKNAMQLSCKCHPLGWCQQAKKCRSPRADGSRTTIGHPGGGVNAPFRPLSMHLCPTGQVKLPWGEGSFNSRPAATIPQAAASSTQLRRTPPGDAQLRRRIRQILQPTTMNYSHLRATTPYYGEKQLFLFA